LIVAVTVELVLLSANTEAGDAVNVEFDALAAAAAGRIATMTAVLSALVIVELFAAIAPEAAWITWNEPLDEREVGAPLVDVIVASAVMPAGAVKAELPAVP
jgi:hypothetical protein